MAKRSSIFDMIGPVMIGPSSSHTAGVARIGRIARHLLGNHPNQLSITFYNSFARTYEGHGSDRAVLAGLMDMMPDDERIREAYEHAEKGGLEFKMKAISNASDLHPNSIRIKMETENRKLNILGVSLGGGLVAIREIDDYPCDFSGDHVTLVLTAEDKHGSIAFIANVIAHDQCNIATMSVNRSAKNGEAKLVIELDSDLNPLTLQYLENLYWVKDVICLDLREKKKA